MSLGQLVLELKLNGNQFTVDLKSASGALQQFVAGTNNANNALNRATRSTRSWGEKLRDVVVTVALVRDAVRTLGDVTLGWQKAIIGANSEMERSIALMKNFSKQRDNAVATQEAIADVNMLMNRAATSPFNLSQVTDAFVKLRVGGVEPVNKSLNTLIDSVAAFGGSGNQLKRAGVAIQQMAGKGVISMEELRQQLGEAVPTAINAMADALGTSYSKLVKEISQGKVTSKPAIYAMMKELEISFKGSAAVLTNTWGGAVAQFETGLKRLAAAFGGMSEDGFAEDGYLKTVTNELKGLNEVLSSPEMLRAAKDLGKAVAEFIKSLANGVKWIMENRDAIVEWGKAVVVLTVAYKGFSIVQGLVTGAGGAIAAFSRNLSAMQAAGASAGGALRNMAVAFTGWNSGAASAAAGATRLATGSTAAATAVRVLGGALGVLAGPIGLVATLAISGGMAYMEYKKGVKAAEDAVLALNGALTDNAQLMILANKRASMQEDYDNKFGKNKGTVTIGSGNFADYASLEEYKKAKAAQEAAMAKIDEDFLKARLNVATSEGKRQAQSEILQIDAIVGELSRKYVIDKEALRKQMEEEAKKDGKATNTEEFSNAFRKNLNQIVELKIGDEIEAYTTARDAAQKAKDDLIQAAQQKGTDGRKVGASQEDLQNIKKQEEIIAQMNQRISDSRDEIASMSKLPTLAETIVGGAGGGGKPQFDMLTMFVDKLRVSVAGLGAKAEEANPYLAQLDATVESLGGKHLPNFDQVYAEGKRLAEVRWEQEKAAKAAKTASDGYKDALERVDQIDTTIRNKLNKVENMNPWEQASADAKRYEDELQDLADKLDETRQKAIASQREGTAQPIIDGLNKQADEYQRRMKEVQETIDRLKVSDVTKKMTEDSRTINESLMSSSDAITAQYRKSLADARAYYGEHKALMTEGSEAYAAYQAYLTSIEEKYRRDNESGLDAWIRTNKDATDQYKSLWASAMDQFNDTLVDGLINGKLELSDFVQYVLKEFLRIQMAKQMAAAAEAIGGASGGGGLLGSLASFGTSLFGGGTGANGFAAGSAAATSSSLGASQAGYSSQYIKFANGGIMTDHGELALRKYANGGIADRPQLALYGEGSMNEAFVPLPDGRSIPVTLSGGKEAAGSQPTGAVPVEVNLYNQSGEKQEAESNARFDGEQMVVDIILKKVSQPGAVRDAVRTAAKS